MSKLINLKESVLNKIWLFKEASTIGQVRQAARDLTKALYELEKSLKDLEK
jgi:hypothetical protein